MQCSAIRMCVSQHNTTSFVVGKFLGSEGSSLSPYEKDLRNIVMVVLTGSLFKEGPRQNHNPCNAFLS